MSLLWLLRMLWAVGSCGEPCKIFTWVMTSLAQQSSLTSHQSPVRLFTFKCCKRAVSSPISSGLSSLHWRWTDNSYNDYDWPVATSADHRTEQKSHHPVSVTLQTSQACRLIFRFLAVLPSVPTLDPTGCRKHLAWEKSSMNGRAESSRAGMAVMAVIWLIFTTN